MTSDSDRAAASETYQEKAWRKFKQQPLVPIGAVATTFALLMAGSKLRKRDSKSMNYWLRARVITQGLTIVALVAGSWMLGQTKPQLDQSAAAVAAADGDADALVGREKRRAEFEERLRGAEESHRLEMAVAGKGPVGEGSGKFSGPPVVGVDKPVGGSGWFRLSKTRKEPPPPTISESEDKKP